MTLHVTRHSDQADTADTKREADKLYACAQSINKGAIHTALTFAVQGSASVAVAHPPMCTEQHPEQTLAAGVA